MKKSLVTLALLGALSPAFAQSTVTLYGTVDAGFGYTKVEGVGSKVGLDSGGMKASRLGFKGTEDLGGGLTGKFVLEQGFNVDTGAATVGSAFSRQAYIGLASKDLGEVRLGRQHSLIYDATAAVDPFGIGLAGNALNFLGNGEYQARINNAVTYNTPSIAGFAGRVQYGFGEVAGDSSANKSVGFGGSYNSGNLGLSLTHATQNFDGVGVNAESTDMLLGATYNLQVAKAHFAYGQSKFENNMTGENDKVNNYLVGVSAPLGSGTVVASYSIADMRNVADADSNQIAVGYIHPLSKRTSLYTSYGRVSNDSNARLVSNVDGASVTKFNVGVNHTF